MLYRRDLRGLEAFRAFALGVGLDLALEAVDSALPCGGGGGVGGGGGGVAGLGGGLGAVIS